MNKAFENIVEKLEFESDSANDKIMEQKTQKARSYYDGYEDGCCRAKEIIWEVAEEYNNGWIPCSEQLPEQPKENPIFENNPLELYLVTVKNTEYAFRAFWNGKHFTDGFGTLDVIAWQPLPEPYQQKGE